MWTLSCPIHHPLPSPQTGQEHTPSQPQEINVQIVHHTPSKEKGFLCLPARVMNFHGKLLLPEIQILQLPPLEYLDGKQRSLNSGIVKFPGRAVPSSLINLSTAESPYQGWNLTCQCFLPVARLLLELETHTHTHTSRCGLSLQVP